MHTIDRLLTWAAGKRGFVLGPLVIDPMDQVWGVQKQDVAPSALGDYLRLNSAVYACITLRAQLLSSLPITVTRLNRQKQRVPVERGPLVDLLSSVNPQWTFPRLIETTEQALGTWGEAFYFLERGANGRGEPTEIYYARPDQVSVVPDPVTYVRGYLFHPTNGTADVAFRPDEVIWLRYPNALDDYAPLPPLMAARPAADYRQEGFLANTRIFKNGMQLGGVVMPGPNSPMRELTADQAKELDAYFTRRFQGQDKAHRWAVLRHEYTINQYGTTPREMDFLGGLNYTLEEVARVYKVPLDLIGGQRTYENADAAMRAIWSHAIIPEARFIASELTERLLPMFPAQAGDQIEFDASGVEALQEAANDAWAREREQIAHAALTVNEWRSGHQLAVVPWGDLPSDYSARVAAAAVLVRDVKRDPDATLAALGLPPIDAAPEPESAPTPEPAEPMPMDQQDPRAIEVQWLPVLAPVRQRQAASIVARLVDDDADPLHYARWVREYRVALRQAGASESDAQRIAYLLNTKIADAVHGIDRSGDRAEMRARVSALLEAV